jgi:histidine triad (HIT) family protein
MYNHAPDGYQCPFCAIVRSDFDPSFVLSSASDVIIQTPLVTALIAAGTWPNNAGNALVVPNIHFENIYELPLEYGTEIHRVSRALALGMRATYGCTGVSTRQHNEPDGYQDVWHFHTHVIPRYRHDFLYPLYPFGRAALPNERADFARRLRDYFETHPEVLA